MKKVYFIFIFFLAFPAWGDSKKVSKDDAKKLAKLEILDRLVNKSYCGFLTNVIFVDEKPIISFSFISVTDRNNTDPGNMSLTPLISIKPRISSFAVAKTKSELEAIKNEKSLQVNESGTKGRIVQFDLLNEKGRKLISEWRDSKTGFEIKTKSFDRRGQLLAIAYYSGLKLNPRHMPTINSKHQKIKLEKFLSEYRFDGDDLESLVKYLRHKNGWDWVDD